MQSDYAGYAELCIIQALLNTASNIMKRLFNLRTVREMCEVISSNDECSTIYQGVSQGTTLWAQLYDMGIVMSNKEK